MVEIVSFNSELLNSPEIVNTDPYGAGWIIRVKLSQASDVDRLLTADQYKAMIS